jgi:hypothetical protein
MSKAKKIDLLNVGMKIAGVAELQDDEHAFRGE